MSAPSPTVQGQGGGSVSADQLNTYVQTIASLAQLRSFIGIDQMEVLLQGYVSQGDGGQGTFVWNATSTGPDDGQNVIVPTSAQVGAWIRLAGATPRLLTLSGIFTSSGSPASNALIDGWVLPGATAFPANFVGSNFHAETRPTAAYIMAIQLNDVTVGSLQVNPDGTYAYTTTNPLGFTALANQWITLVGNSAPDATLNNFFFTLVGTLK